MKKRNCILLSCLVFIVCVSILLPITIKIVKEKQEDLALQQRIGEDKIMNQIDLSYYHSERELINVCDELITLNLSMFSGDNYCAPFTILQKENNNYFLSSFSANGHNYFDKLLSINKVYTSLEMKGVAIIAANQNATFDEYIYVVYGVIDAQMVSSCSAIIMMNACSGEQINTYYFEGVIVEFVGGIAKDNQQFGGLSIAGSKGNQPYFANYGVDMTKRFEYTYPVNGLTFLNFINSGINNKYIDYKYDMRTCLE